MSQHYSIQTVTTKPISGQKMGTSGLRKKVKVVETTPHYIENMAQSLLNTIYELEKTKTDAVRGSAKMAIGGDGRYYNKVVIQTIIKILAGNAETICKLFSTNEFVLYVAQNGIMSTPAMSSVIRGRHCNLGGFILTASHNPGGPENDFGIKYNEPNGGPARESVTDLVFAKCESISEYFIAKDLPEIDLSQKKRHQFGSFVVEVIDSADDYVYLLKTEVFDFAYLKQFLSQSNFKFLFDSLNGVTGAYTKRIFCDELGLDASKCLQHSTPLEDFGGLHPDPNATYAADLVKKMYDEDFDMGVASDGDGDRNMILGRKFFVTPSDSVAVIAEYAAQCIPYFKKLGKLKGVARSMPTSTALDRVAKNLGLECFETPTGWKFFGNLMDAGRLSVCGEESFGTGSDHIREKDGIFAVLCWLSICAHVYHQKGKLVSIAEIVQDHWRKFGRSFYVRFDYEEVASQGANQMMQRMDNMIAASGSEKFEKGQKFGNFVLDRFDNFTYIDPIDKSVSKNQGIRIFFTDGSRIVFRLSGTGSAGATIRIYIETYKPFNEQNSRDILEGDAKEVVKELFAVAKDISKIQEHTGRTEPSVIT